MAQFDFKKLITSVDYIIPSVRNVTLGNIAQVGERVGEMARLGIEWMDQQIADGDDDGHHKAEVQQHLSDTLQSEEVLHMLKELEEIKEGKKQLVVELEEERKLKENFRRALECKEEDNKQLEIYILELQNQLLGFQNGQDQLLEKVAEERKLKEFYQKDIKEYVEDQQELEACIEAQREQMLGFVNGQEQLLLQVQKERKLKESCEIQAREHLVYQQELEQNITDLEEQMLGFREGQDSLLNQMADIRKEKAEEMECLQFMNEKLTEAIQTIYKPRAANLKQKLKEVEAKLNKDLDLELELTEANERIHHLIDERYHLYEELKKAQPVVIDDHADDDEEIVYREEADNTEDDPFGLRTARAQFEAVADFILHHDDPTSIHMSVFADADEEYEYENDEYWIDY